MERNENMTPLPMTKFQAHVERWKDCAECDLCDRRRHVVLSRGKVPCDVMYVGEAPGQGEDIRGLPFVGPAGQLLDVIVMKAVDMSGVDGLRMAYTNVIACIPKGEDGVKSDPPFESMEACRPRLEEFIALGNPRLIVAVGAVSFKCFERGMKHSVKYDRQRTDLITITHPSAILRDVIAARSLRVHRCVVQLSDAFTKLAKESKAAKDGA